MNYEYRHIPRHLAIFLALILSATGLMAQQKALLFSDTFNRANSTNLNESADGQSGPLSPLTYGWQAYFAAVDINNNTLRMDNELSDGARGGIAYPLYNFTNSVITDDEAFSVTVDLNFNSTGGNRWMSVGVGQSLAELQAVTDNFQATALPADLLVGYKGTRDRLDIYNNGVLNTAETITNGLPADPLTMRIEYSSVTDFNSGSTINYEVFFDDAVTNFTSGSFEWSGTGENYISLSGNTTGSSRFDNFEIRGGSTASDVTPPSPSPMSWVNLPAAISSSEISMTATNATDDNGVEYNFECTVGGGPDSGWQAGTAFTATGLVAETTYTYTVKARDLSVNTNVTAASTAEQATTLALDDTPPDPDPMTWAEVPVATSHSSISMTATTATDTNGVEYYFANITVTNGSHDSGWQDIPSYTDNGLDPETTYSYAVKARDNSPDGFNETAYSVTNSATTEAASGPITSYSDTFDNDGLDVNAGDGGGMGTFSKTGGPFVDNGVMDPQATAHNHRGNVYSLNDFNLSSGFRMEVTYEILFTTNLPANRVNIGVMIATNNFENQGTPYLTDYLSNNRGQYGIGMDLTANDGNQGLSFSDGTSITELSAIEFPAGTNSFVLQVNADSSWSYSINDGAEVTGTVPGGFDLVSEYKFFTFVQDSEQQFKMHSVSLQSLGVTEIGPITMVVSGTQADLTWFGDFGGSYDLQVADGLVGQPWDTVTNIAGAGAEITVTEDLDETAEFYRVKLAE